MSLRSVGEIQPGLARAEHLLYILRESAVSPRPLHLHYPCETYFPVSFVFFFAYIQEEILLSFLIFCDILG
jgi:hypothetical protein